MIEFVGCRFRPTGEIEKKTNRYGETVYKEKFIPTAQYVKYLREKRAAEERLELEVLRQKLEYQMTTYGYVDDLDLAEYQRRVLACY